MAKSPLYYKRVPGGIDTVIDVTKIAGDIFYVDSGNSNGADAAGYGTDPNAPFLSNHYASSQCTANNGDHVFSLPGHTETISSAGAATFSKDGVTFIPLGEGNDRATITFDTATTASIVFSGASVKFGLPEQKFICVAGIDALVNPLHTQAAGQSINVEWRDGSATVEAERAILTTAAADNLTVNLDYKGFTAGNATVNAVRLVGVDNAEINVNFYGVASTSVVEFHTTACTNIKVNLPYVHNHGTALTKNVVDTATGSTWIAQGFDAVGGYSFSGGSAVALAGDDVSSISTALATLQAEVSGAAGLVSFPTGAAAGNGVSLAEVLRYTQELLDTVQAQLSGAAGIASFPAAAAAANAVSLAEVIRYIQDNTTAVAPGTFVPGLGYRVTKTEDVNTATSDDLFDVVGKVRITLWTLEVTNAIGAGVTDYILRIKTDNTAITASTDISSAAIGVIMNVTGDAADTLETAGEGVKTCDHSDSGIANRIVGLASGTCTIESVRTAGDASDAIIHVLFYQPLEAGASVTAAA